MLRSLLLIDYYSSSIFRKSSWENNDTIVDSSFMIDAVINVSLESGNVIGEGFFIFVVDDEKRCSVFDVVGRSDVAFIRKLWYCKN